MQFDCSVNMANRALRPWKSRAKTWHYIVKALVCHKNQSLEHRVQSNTQTFLAVWTRRDRFGQDSWHKAAFIITIWINSAWLGNVSVEKGLTFRDTPMIKIAGLTEHRSAYRFWFSASSEESGSSAVASTPEPIQTVCFICTELFWLINNNCDFD